jgi:pimeloyl-ACP methyl ester carboxylesterase
MRRGHRNLHLAKEDDMSCRITSTPLPQSYQVGRGRLSIRLFVTTALLAIGHEANAASEPTTTATSAEASPSFRPVTERAKIDGAAPQSVNAEMVRPFKFRASDEALADLRRRISATKWPNKEPVGDDSKGVQLATMQKLASYWANKYDWRKVEARLNALPQFVTNIDGLDIHFIHIRSKHPNALPLIVSHGWPGSVVEQLKLVGPLTDPTAHGGTSADAFDLVIPSMPGYGFSEVPAAAGWGPERIARAWDQLMVRLGYKKYVAQGGDWGALIVDLMAIQAPPGLLGIHTNMAGTVPADVDALAFSGAPTPAHFSLEEKQAYDQLAFFYKHGLAYAQEMGSRPQTLYGIDDSPIGLAAWILDHDIRSYQMMTRVFDGKPEGLSRDDVLDNITLFWLTNTGVSSAQLYAENTFRNFFGRRNVKLPTVISVFPDEISPAPRSWAKEAYPNLLLYNRHPKGGHFAAWEQPQAIIADLRAGFRTLRK